MKSRLPYLLAGAAVAATTSSLTGCSSAITSDRLQPEVGTTFGNLYVRQQAVLGHPGIDASATQAGARCARRGSDTPSRGAGDDWTCELTWQGADGSPLIAVYEVQVRANGCFTATGPPNIVGVQTLTTPEGGRRVNPLYQFDGCFDPA
jgi:hypothetical protein